MYTSFWAQGPFHYKVIKRKVQKKQIRQKAANSHFEIGCELRWILENWIIVSSQFTGRIFLRTDGVKDRFKVS